MPITVMKLNGEAREISDHRIRTVRYVKTAVPGHGVVELGSGMGATFGDVVGAVGLHDDVLAVFLGAEGESKLRLLDVDGKEVFRVPGAVWAELDATEGVWAVRSGSPKLKDQHGYVPIGYVREVSPLAEVQQGEPVPGSA